MIELAARIPARLSPGQTFLIAVLAFAVLLAVLGASFFESAFTAIVSLFLRLIGHRPPRRSSFSAVLDDFEARTNRDKDGK